MQIRDITIQDFEKVNELMREVHALHVQNRPDLYIDMEDLCVRRQDRAQGIGTQLFEYAQGQARKMGAERLDLMVWGFNQAAADFYEKMGMKDNIQELNQKVKKIDLVLENEIRVNIQRVAEGHLDLSRNLHEAMKTSNEIEMLSIKVRRLETDVRELKDKIS